MSDLDVITNTFQQIIKSSGDGIPEHNIFWPQYGPDPVYFQADLPVDCYIDIQLMATESYGEQQQLHLELEYLIPEAQHHQLQRQLPPSFLFQPVTKTLLVWPRHGPEPFSQMLCNNIMRNPYYHWNTASSLGDWLKEEGIPGLC
eukprot:350877-Ditylum_brightwellii.AAC.1